MSYSDGVRLLVDKDVQDDINDACSNLAHAMSTMMDRFDSIAKQMHTLDLLRHTAPLKPRWGSMRKVSTLPYELFVLLTADTQDVAGLLWQFRTNAGVISGRLKREPSLDYIEAFLSARADVYLSLSLLHRGVAYGGAEYRWKFRSQVSLPSGKSSSVAVLHDRK